MSLVKVAQILLIALAACAYATWLTSTRQEPATPAARHAIPATDIPLLRTAEAKALWDRSSTLFLDVRSSEDFAYGHIAGAVNAPGEDVDVWLPALRARLERARALVVYCKSQDCGQSLWTALRLRQRGLTQISIYPAGWHEWYLRGLPTERSAAR